MKFIKMKKQEKQSAGLTNQAPAIINHTIKGGLDESSPYNKNHPFKVRV